MAQQPNDDDSASGLITRTLVMCSQYAVELASEKELVPTLEIIKAAVLAGELDAAIDVASNKLRDGFAR